MYERCERKGDVRWAETELKWEKPNASLVLRSRIRAQVEGAEFELLYQMEQPNLVVR